MVDKKCVSCNDTISATGRGVEFKCPKCSETIVRCGRCRKLMVKWKCPNCAYEGP